ncbi:hypothetical protein TNCV_2925131 [Trichonephila clavipes]|nr:hypothetical protein TNCV_2925131 [Trichonephila clavipes]
MAPKAALANIAVETPWGLDNVEFSQYGTIKYMIRRKLNVRRVKTTIVASLAIREYFRPFKVSCCGRGSLVIKWLDSPEWALTFSKNLFLASLLPTTVLQFLVLKTRRSFSRPSIHLRFGLPFLRMLIG